MPDEQRELVRPSRRPLKARPTLRGSVADRDGRVAVCGGAVHPRGVLRLREGLLAIADVFRWNRFPRDGGESTPTSVPGSARLPAQRSCRSCSAQSEASVWSSPNESMPASRRGLRIRLPRSSISVRSPPTATSHADRACRAGCSRGGPRRNNWSRRCARWDGSSPLADPANVCRSSGLPAST